MKELQKSLNTEFNALKAKIEASNTDLKGKIQASNTDLSDLKGKIQATDADLKGKIANIEATDVDLQKKIDTGYTQLEKNLSFAIPNYDKLDEGKYATHACMC